MSLNSKKLANQRGIISIMMAMMLIIITGLIVLGFAQLSRRTQRETLDAQLSSQAYYAAESGINQAITAIINKINAGRGVPAKTTCDSLSDPNYPDLVGNNAKIDPTNNVSYTCLLIQPQSPQLTATIGSSPVVFSLKTSNGNLSSVTLHWQEPKNLPGGSNFGKCPVGVSGQNDFLQSSRWRCKYGGVRMDLAATDNLSQAALRDSANSMTTFILPTRSGAGFTNFGSKQIVDAKCSNNDGCYATITSLGGHGDYSLRVSSLYLDNFEINVEGINTKGAPAQFVGQATIDATGKAQDVLRRIVEVVSLVGSSDGNNLPPAALTAGDSVCKRFGTYQSGSSHFWIASVIFIGGGNNPLCRGYPDTSPPPPPPKQPPPPPAPTCPNDEDVMFTLDYSDSMNNQWQTTTRIGKLIKVAQNFTQSVGMGPNTVHVGVVTFNGKIESGSQHQNDPHYPPELTKLTSDPKPVMNAFENTPLKLGTLYTDGLDLTDKEFNSSDARADTQHIMIFISDGQPTEPNGPIIQKINQMKAEGIAVYTIGVVPDPQSEAILRGMAGNGGRYVRADLESQLDAILDEISRNLNCKS